MTKAKLERINPDTLRQAPHYSAVVTSEGGKLAHVAGAMAVTKEGLQGAGDLSAQMKQTYENILLALKGAGATPSDVVRQRMFVVDLKPEHRDLVMKSMQEFYGIGPRPASTLIGVAALVIEGALVEIDVTAAIDS